MITALALTTAGLLAQQAPAIQTPAPEAELLLRTFEGGVMGTDLKIEALGTDAAKLDLAIAAAVAELNRVEDLMTDWRPSELMRLNAAAGTGPVEVDPELGRLIGRALDISGFTDGAFDVTYAGVGRLWDFKRVPVQVPDQAAVDAALLNVGYQRVVMNAERTTVDLPAGMSIGLGGIAKGYGVDRAMSVLMEHGVEHGIVNAGGDLKALGRKLGEPWEVAIRHPRDEERVLAVIPVVNSCIVTSGDYARFFEYEGQRYHHILDPRTGFPSRGCMSATVVAPEAATADALATALCVLGPERGLELVESLSRVEALLVGLDGEVHASTGLISALAPAVQQR